MRLSITLDPQLHQITATRARARRTSISQEINELLRQAIAAPQPDCPPLRLIRPEGRRGFPVSQGLRPFTSEDVARLEDEDDLRHLHG
ncbi:MAG: hypothetical protein IPL39_10120 [Opitutaceae bacterium]|nr:hypothetical protein [Opitutaceae bacterium]